MPSMADHNHGSALRGHGRTMLRDTANLLETESGHDVLTALPEDRPMPGITTAVAEESGRDVEKPEGEKQDEPSNQGQTTPLPDFPSPFRRNLVFVAVSLSIFLVRYFFYHAPLSGCQLLTIRQVTLDMVHHSQNACSIPQVSR